MAIPATAIPMDGKNGVKVGNKMERYNSSHQVLDKETTIRGGMRDEIIMFFQIRELLCQLAELYEQVRELCEQVQELWEQVQELWEQVRDLRRKPSAMSGWAGEGNIPAEKPKHH